jgi:hypothetical protein
VALGSITPASCGDFWCNPGIFSKALGLAGGSLTIVPFSLKVFGQSYQGIRFEYNDATARYVSVSIKRRASFSITSRQSRHLMENICSWQLSSCVMSAKFRSPGKAVQLLLGFKDAIR